ncbi:MAG: hypothetical protein SFX18_15805 [Pirellulales bacterium]|nr:hypothetical protein [Pirellulales bacterium]
MMPPSKARRRKLSRPATPIDNPPSSPAPSAESALVAFLTTGWLVAALLSACLTLGWFAAIFYGTITPPTPRQQLLTEYLRFAALCTATVTLILGLIRHRLCRAPAPVLIRRVIWGIVLLPWVVTLLGI